MLSFLLPFASKIVSDAVKKSLMTQN